AGALRRRPLLIGRRQPPRTVRQAGDGVAGHARRPARRGPCVRLVPRPWGRGHGARAGVRLVRGAGRSRARDASHRMAPRMEATPRPEGPVLVSPARVEEAPIRCAVLDLGSTSFQLLVTDAEADGTLTHVLRDRVILNLGADVAATGRVPEE